MKGCSGGLIEISENWEKVEKGREINKVKNETRFNLSHAFQVPLRYIHNIIDIFRLRRHHPVPTLY